MTRKRGMSYFRIGVCNISQEGNSFTSLETSLSDFESYGDILVGHEVLEHPERRDEVTGFAKTIEKGIKKITGEDAGVNIDFKRVEMKQSGPFDEMFSEKRITLTEPSNLDEPCVALPPHEIPLE